MLYNCGWFCVAVELCVRGGGHCQRNPSVTLRLCWEPTTSWSPTNSAAGSWSHRSWSVETCSCFCYIIIMMNFCRPPHLQMNPNCLATAIKDNRHLLLLTYNHIGWMHFLRLTTPLAPLPDRQMHAHTHTHTQTPPHTHTCLLIHSLTQTTY